MSNPNTNLADLMLSRSLLSAEQLAEAQAMQQQTGAKLEDLLVKLGFLTASDILLLLAEIHCLQIIDLTGVTVPPAIIEMVPESVARENVILPLAADAQVLWVVIGDPFDMDTLQKLAFILNKQIRPVLAFRKQIVEAINCHYGHTETESVDSMLSEFTDTQIDFTQLDGAASCVVVTQDREEDEDDVFETDFDCALEEEAEEGSEPTDTPIDYTETAAAPRASIDLDCHQESDKPLVRRPAKAKTGRSPAPVERRATVRYYERMNPQRMFPLLVVLSRHEIQQIVKRQVTQAQSKSFQVAAKSPVEVEPVLAGCSCYPPKEHIDVSAETASVTFWVVPHVLGRIMHARVVVRQEGRVLTEVPLEMRVTQQSLTLLLGALSLVLPLLLMLLRHYNLDFESQLADGFGLYAQIGNWVVSSLSPEVLTGAMLVAAALAYWWLRPRQRDVFWDVTPAKSNAKDDLPAPQKQRAAKPDATRVEAGSERQATLLVRAEQLFQERDFTRALALYESALTLGPSASPLIYHHASLAAHHSGSKARALSILKEAEARLQPKDMKGVLWFNMACFATGLGRFEEAMRCLHQAVERGYRDPLKYRNDPDLEPLRWRPKFRRLLGELGLRPTPSRGPERPTSPVEK
jgi:hypothetical protein